MSELWEGLTNWWILCQRTEQHVFIILGSAGLPTTFGLSLVCRGKNALEVFGLHCIDLLLRGHRTQEVHETLGEVFANEDLTALDPK